MAALANDSVIWGKTRFSSERNVLDTVCVVKPSATMLTLERPGRDMSKSKLTIIIGLDFLNDGSLIAQKFHVGTSDAVAGLIDNPACGPQKLRATSKSARYRMGA
jgi:hypothetical protein